MTKKLKGISKCLPILQAEIDKANSLPLFWDEDIERYIEDETDKEKTFPPDLPAQESYSYDLLMNLNFFYDLVKSATKPEEKRKREKDMFKKIISELPSEFININTWINKVLSQKTVTLDSRLKKSKKYKWLFDNLEDKFNKGRWFEFDIQNGEVDQFSPLSRLGNAMGEAGWTRKAFIEVIGWNKRCSYTKRAQIPPQRKFLVFTLENGILDVQILAPVLQMLKDLRVDTQRLGKCPSCKKIFWRQRENASTCSRPCANKYHQKKIQIDEQKRTLLNEARRKNYKHNKKLKENKFSAQQADAVLNRKFHSKLRGIKPVRND